MWTQGSAFDQCPVCGGNFIKALLSQHVEGCLEIKERKGSLDASTTCSIQGSMEDMPCSEAFSSQTLIADASSGLPLAPALAPDVLHDPSNRERQSAVLNGSHASKSDAVEEACQRATSGLGGRAHPQECEKPDREKELPRDWTECRVGTVLRVSAGSRPHASCPETGAHPGPQLGDHRLPSCESQRVEVTGDSAGCTITFEAPEEQASQLVSSYENSIARHCTTCSVTETGLPNGDGGTQNAAACSATSYGMHTEEPTLLETRNYLLRDGGLHDPAQDCHNVDSRRLATAEQGACGTGEDLSSPQGPPVSDVGLMSCEDDAAEPVRPCLPTGSACMARRAAVRPGIEPTKSHAMPVQSEVGRDSPRLPSDSFRAGAAGTLARPQGNGSEGGAIVCLPSDRGSAGGDAAAEDVFAKMLKGSREQARPGAGRTGPARGKDTAREAEQGAHQQGLPPARNAFSRMMEGQREQSRIHNFYLEHRGDGRWVWHWWDAHDPAARPSLRGNTGEAPHPPRESRGFLETADGTGEPDSVHAQDCNVPQLHGLERAEEAPRLGACGKDGALSGDFQEVEGGTPGAVLQSQVGPGKAGMLAKGTRGQTLPYVWSAVVKARPSSLHVLKLLLSSCVFFPPLFCVGKLVRTIFNANHMGEGP